MAVLIMVGLVVLIAGGILAITIVVLGIRGIFREARQIKRNAVLLERRSEELRLEMRKRPPVSGDAAGE